MAGLDALLSTLHLPPHESRRMTRSRTGSLHLRSYRTFIRYSHPALTGAFPDPFSYPRAKHTNLKPAFAILYRNPRSSKVLVHPHPISCVRSRLAPRPACRISLFRAYCMREGVRPYWQWCWPVERRLIRVRWPVVRMFCRIAGGQSFEVPARAPKSRLARMLVFLQSVKNHATTYDPAMELAANRHRTV
jgi:hypothetical protein